MEECRIGVFACQCGGNISDVVDVKKITWETSAWENVSTSRSYAYLCSKPGIELIKNSIKKHKLNRIVIAGCTPKMHRRIFEKVVEEEGLNPAFLEIANIREHCSWVHLDDPEGATSKALDLIRGNIKKVEKAAKLEPIKAKVTRSCLVVGGGIAGIIAALRLAEAGLKTYLVEKEPSIGGHMIKFAEVFPTLDCSQCILSPRIADVASSPNIELLSLAEVKSISGVPGNFRCMISLKPRGVNVEKCINCGACSRACPIEVKSEFDEGIGKRKAAYIPFPQSVPSTYAIDLQNCTKCGKCVEVCPTEAINLDDKENDVEINVGSIVLATGYELFDLSELGQYGYGRYPDAINPLQMERMMDVAGPTKGKIIRLSDDKDVRKVAYVLCAGSRDVTKGLPYCSRVCCMYSLKHAILLRDKGIDVWIYYTDIRAPGRRYEEFYREAQKKGAIFVKGKVADVVPKKNQLLVRAVDLLSHFLLENEFDLVVLCPPIIPSSEGLNLIEALKLPMDEDKYILEEHPKLNPLATKRAGIFSCGMCSGPKDIQTTVTEAEGAAIKTMNFLAEAGLIEPNKAFLRNIEACNGCGECAKVCPTGAISIVKGKARIDELACNGCGICIPSCPTNAIDRQGLTDDQLLAQIEGTLIAGV